MTFLRPLTGMLLVGTVLSLVIAWCSAIAVDPTGGARHDDVVRWHRRKMACARHRQPSVTATVLTPWLTLGHRQRVPLELREVLAGRTDDIASDLVGTPFLVVEAHGWPFRCVWCRHVWNGSRFDVHGGIETGLPDRSGVIETPRALPMRIIPAGLAGNAAILGLSAWVVAAGIRRLRRAIRAASARWGSPAGSPSTPVRC